MVALATVQLQTPHAPDQDSLSLKNSSRKDRLLKKTNEGPVPGLSGQ